MSQYAWKYLQVSFVAHVQALVSEYYSIYKMFVIVYSY